MSFYTTILKPTFQIVNPNDKNKGIWIVGLMVLNALFDFFSIASFLPLLLLIVNPDFVSSNKYIHYLYTNFHFTSLTSFIIAFTGFILVFILIKTVVTFGIARSKANYCFTLGSSLSSRMLERYMGVGYLKFTKMDFARELDRIANLPIAFANNIIMPLANLLSEGLIFLILLICIAFYDVTVFAMLIIILTPIGLVYILKRNSLSRTSDELNKKYPLSLKYALQIVEGLVDIKAFGRESFFKRRFDKTSEELAKTFARDHTNQTSASRLTEVIVAFIICSLVVYSVLNNKSYQETFLLLGIYSGASFRMVPSLNRILNALLQIKSHQYLFAELAELINLKQDGERAAVSPLPFTRTIELKDLTFQYPDGAKVLQGTSLIIHKGDKIALVGKSGSGKTTILMLLLQFLKGNSGRIFLDGVEIRDDNLIEWRSILSFVPQSPYLLDGTIIENIAFGFSPESINHERIQHLIRDLDLEGMISQLPDGLSTQIGEKGVKLSGGQRQRIAIARALYTDAEVLLFDEITNQLDARTELEIVRILEKITRQKKTILMITHHEHLLNEFDRILSLEDGIIVEKTVTRNPG